MGLLQDAAAIDAQIAREAEREAAKKASRETLERKARSEHSAVTAAVQTAKTQDESNAENAEKARERKEISERLRKEAEEKSKSRRTKIRPLSEAKAIDSGATFISETFLFLIGVGAILGERWWSNKKEESRREGVEERLQGLESELGDWKERALKAELQQREPRPVQYGPSIQHDMARGRSDQGNTASGDSRRERADHSISTSTRSGKAEGN